MIQQFTREITDTRHGAAFQALTEVYLTLAVADRGRLEGTVAETLGQHFLTDWQSWRDRLEEGRPTQIRPQGEGVVAVVYP